MHALEEACENLPDDRNPFEIEIRRPTGSMYPQMTINKLPYGISLDWLSSGLATKGIGLIPLTLFARTATNLWRSTGLTIKEEEIWITGVRSVVAKIA